MSILGHLSNTEVVNLYNIFAKQNGSAVVKKFRDKQTGHSRLQDITRSKDRRIVVAALKAVGIKPEIIKLLPDTPVAVAEPSVVSTVPLPKKVDAAKVLSEAKAKEDLRHTKVDKKVAAVVRKEVKMTDHCAEVFATIKAVCTASKDKEVNTTELQKKLSTGWPTVSKAVEKLQSLGMVTIEDDSADDNNPLWYVRLTKAGLATSVPSPVTKTDSTGDSPAPKKKALPSDKPGPRSSKVGKKIYKLVDGNPRREGTHGFTSFALIKDGMPYDDYIKAGGRNNDLGWDIDHKYVELR